MSGFPIPDAGAVLDLVAAYLATDLGAGALERLEFQTDREELVRGQRRIGESQLWLERRGGFDFASLGGDPRPWIEGARDLLEGAELVQLRQFLEAASALASHIGTSPDWPLLAELAAEIAPLPELRQRLRRALLPDGTLEDEASPELARIRRQRQRQRQAIEAQLGEHLRRLGGEGIAQDEWITLRNERFVLPVRSSERRRAPGIVHGASSSGLTVFVEPLETVELNNENIQLRDRELAEIHRILAELSALVRAQAPAIAASAAACAALEFESAKARFARDYGGVPAEFGDELELQRARHPLLVATLRREPGRAVVPLSLRLGAPARVLILSGPNTGGKTVVLKTVGIAAWMAQCGLPVCAERARLPIFDALWADIGDVQSLERSLSTFSSHLLHIREILEAASPRTLVLLDELGTATNAAEGAALAIEISDTLARRGSYTLISTHHDELKAWAGAHPESVVNGSVALDPETLAPSYQFRMGVPGVSAGLDIAGRLGLPPELIAGARARLSHEQREAAHYLDRLQRNLAAAEERVAELDRREQELSQRERQAAAHDRQYQQRHIAALRAEMERRLAAFTTSAEAQWRRAMADLATTLTSAQQRKVALTMAQLKRQSAEAFAQQVGTVIEGEGPGGEAPSMERDPEPGERVRLRSMRQPATVLRRLADGNFELAAGSLRLQVSRTEIVGFASEPPRPAPVAQVESAAVRELNLIGLRMEEAVEKLDKFLDQAILAETAEVRIVHGAGFGVLRKAVGELLRRHPQVASYAHPPQNQGGQGVTVAVLK